MKSFILILSFSFVINACASPVRLESAAESGVYNPKVSPQQQDMALTRDMDACIKHAYASMPGGAYTSSRPARVTNPTWVNSTGPNLGAFVAGMDAAPKRSRANMNHPYHVEAIRRSEVCLASNGWQDK